MYWRWSGWIYVAFVIDAYSRRILGWRAATSMSTHSVVDAIERAIWIRAREGITDLSGLIDHDRGARYTSIAYTERLAEAGFRRLDRDHRRRLRQRVGRDDQRPLQDRADQTRGPWRTPDRVEIATPEWVDWFNHRRLYEHCGDLPTSRT